MQVKRAGVKRSKNLTQWGEDVQLLTLGQEEWPWSQGRLTAATVIDLRHEPKIGKYIFLCLLNRAALRQIAASFLV